MGYRSVVIVSYVVSIVSCIGARVYTLGRMESGRLITVGELDTVSTPRMGYPRMELHGPF